MNRGRTDLIAVLLYFGTADTPRIVWLIHPVLFQSFLFPLLSISTFLIPAHTSVSLASPTATYCNHLSDTTIHEELLVQSSSYTTLSTQGQAS
jgi:hypothetical protein